MVSNIIDDDESLDFENDFENDGHDELKLYPASIVNKCNSKNVKLIKEILILKKKEKLYETCDAILIGYFVMVFATMIFLSVQIYRSIVDYDIMIGLLMVTCIGLASIMVEYGYFKSYKPNIFEISNYSSSLGDVWDNEEDECWNDV